LNLLLTKVGHNAGGKTGSESGSTPPPCRELAFNFVKDPVNYTPDVY